MKNNIVIKNDDYDKIMLGKEWHNGDWNLRLATKIMFLENYLSEEELKDSGIYEVSIIAVSPEAAGIENINRAIDSSFGNEQFEYEYKEYLALIEYGIYATLFHKSGNNVKKLLHEANQELQAISAMFGFYMDNVENRIGNTGWDFISGNIGFN